MNKYGKLVQAETRLRKLEKDGVVGAHIVSQGGWHWVEGAPVKSVELSVFGLLMEAEEVQLAALDSDPTAINFYDVGETFGDPASELLGTKDRVRAVQRVVEFEDINPVQQGAHMIGPKEMRDLERKEG